VSKPESPLAAFHAPVRAWFEASFAAATPAQARGFPVLVAGASALIFAPTGSGKTLAAFLTAIDRLMFSPEPDKRERCRVLYVSPLKALATDVEKNLRAPIAGIARVAAQSGVRFRVPTVAVRSGDTPASERARLGKAPPDILITTPESLYLVLTSAARAGLASVETVIVDEIHSLVPTKRGAHLFLSLERLEALRPRGAAPLQRIGLSATQRPLEEVARLLGGGEIGSGGAGTFTPRPVTILDAGATKAWDLRVEMPVEALVPGAEERPATPTKGRSIWPSIHPRLVELVRAHRSTMIFANSRRLAERLAAAINETAGEEIALAHHGSIAKETRLAIEERLKRGELPAIVATSSLELGIDIGAIDLVVQIEAPPSVASGLQRIGRAGHSVGAVSRGIIFPKYRGDLLAAATATLRMVEGKVEETFYPRNPLDVLAQQIVAEVSMEPTTADALYTLVRRAAPFADLPRASFEGVLDMLSGRYPSDEFAELRPRLTWDRESGALRGRESARRIAVINGGTIPDRGLYGVYLQEGDAKSRRVGELDEEMVFESRVGDVFLLGASSWRIAEITHDRVLVTPAPGEPGKMPFWRGDRPGRPPELGRAIGALSRALLADAPAAAQERLRRQHGLDERAADTLLTYLREQAAATGEVPSDRTLVVERYRDEIGDYRVCLLSPFGSRVHAPWCTAVLAKLRETTDQGVEGIWSDDGMVFRLPGSDDPPDVSLLFPAPEAIEDLVVQSLGGSAVFAARFRENAGRALLLPRRHPGQRSPLWATRKKAADLLAVASRYGSFPLLLETYRECLRDVFDLPGLVELLAQIASRAVRVLTVDSRIPSPFAASLLFSYVGNFLYDGDAPLAERRAHALSVDAAQLRELLGEAELRELLDAGAIADQERALQRLDARRPVAHADALHDLLLSLGDLTEPEIAARCAPPDAAPTLIAELTSARRILAVTLAGERRFAAAEDAARLRDALGVKLPRGLPAALLEPVADPLGDLVSRYARTHGPFLLETIAARFGLGVAPARAALERLAAAGRVVEGEISPGVRSREWCDAEVLRQLKRRSLARLRKEVEPVEPPALGRFLAEWHGLHRLRTGPDALLRVVEQLQGAPLPASVLETDVLPARIRGYLLGDLDRLCAAGEVAWVGLEPLGPRDGRIALYLADQLPLLAPPPRTADGDLAARLRALFEQRGALFFSDLAAETGAFAPDILAALWEMVWAGEVTNDTLAPLRSLWRGAGAEGKARERRMALRGGAFGGRRAGPPGSEGRWSRVARGRGAPTETERRAALAKALLERHGVLTREAVHAEGIQGGFSAVYDVLKAMEEAGRVRRGYFVAGLGATQFALPGAEDRLRAVREAPEEARVWVVAATDPANPYGAALGWPGSGEEEETGAHGQRAAGAHVVLRNGELIGYVGRTEKNLLTFLPGEEPERGYVAEALAKALAGLVEQGRRKTLLIAKIDGVEAERSALGARLGAVGFTATSKGYFKRGDAHRAKNG
jgi:ATP-dependent helicase Lhr and Lhr-like helicase